jgi:hypothetical protein
MITIAEVIPTMTEYDDLLEKVEEATKKITDETLRRIAFERLLDHELALHSGTKSPHPRRADPVIIPSAIPKPAGKYKGKPAHANPASSVRDEVKNLSVSPDEHGLPPWGQLKVLDKYLWILEAAHLKGLDALTSAEISHLIFAVFRENQGTNKVKNLKTRIKATHVRLAKIQQTTGDLQGWQILKGGKDHLKNLVAAGAAKS